MSLPIRVSLLLAAIALALTACPNEQPPPPGGCNPACGANEQCVNGFCDPLGNPDAGPDGGTPDGGCNPACATDYSCQSGGCVLTGSVPTASCSPTIVFGGFINASLATYYDAGTHTYLCYRPVVSPSLPSGWVQNLGTQTVGTQQAFNVPSGTQSISIVSQAVSTSDNIGLSSQPDGGFGNVVVPDQVHGPSGALFYDDVANPPTDPTTASAWFLSYSVSTGAFTMPNTTPMLNVAASGGMPSGTWHFNVNDYSHECATVPSLGCGGNNNGRYNVQVVTKPGPASATGTMDIGVYVATHSLDAGSAVSDPSVRRLVTTFNDIYAQAGICLGTVSIYELPSWAKDRYATGIASSSIGPCDPLDQMLTLSQPGNTVNLFLVDDISGGQSGTHVVGLDGEIPAPSGFGGSNHSGAAVSIADLKAGACGSSHDFVSCGADFTAYIAAHESGHWLGLYHTTEHDGHLADPLVDTGACPCHSCASNTNTCYDVMPSSPHLMTTAECEVGTVSCAGGENLMFWVASNSSVGLLTPEQGAVMRANVAVH